MNYLKTLFFLSVGVILTLLSCGSREASSDASDQKNISVLTLNVPDTHAMTHSDSGERVNPEDSSIEKSEKGIQVLDSVLDTSTLKNDDSKIVAYDLKKYAEMWSLNSDLLEISGLSMTASADALLGVNDEKAFIYKISKKDGSIIEKWDFGKAGDYEGIEQIDESIYTLKSNGRLYKYTPSSSSTEVIKTPLSLANDVEGLGVTQDKKKLLLACKGRPTLKKADTAKKEKAVYALDLQSGKLFKDPYLIVKDKDLTYWLEQHMNMSQYTKKQIKATKGRVKTFSPSGIAVHPINHNIYILSTQGKSLVVVNSAKLIERIYLLDDKIHAQPEGICFAKNGDLYISNEGRGLVARIYRYQMVD